MNSRTLNKTFVAPTVNEEVGPKPSTAATSLWDRVVGFLERAAAQRHIVALRDGMIGAVPVILVGSTFLLLGVQGGLLKELHLDQTAFGLWYTETAPLILLPYRYTMGLLSLYVSFTIAAALAKQYDAPQIPAGLTSMATFLIAGELITGKIYLPGQTLEELEKIEAAKFIAAGPLGADGLFLAIIVGVLTVELGRRLTFMPKTDENGSTAGVPPAVIQAFASFLPMLVCVSLMWGFKHLVGVDIYGVMEDQTEWLKRLGDSYPAVIIINVLLHMFGVAGVHGISVINAGMLPVWQQFLIANADAHEMGKALPYVTAFPFHQWFIWIGGAGATLSPTIRCCFSKNAHVKKMGRVALVPAFFNINEPLLFGLPIVANPILGVPFVVTPLVCGTIAFFATSWGWVGKTFIEVPWVMPCFFGAYLSTQDVMAVGLLMVNLVVSYLIWAPFITRYEKRLALDAAEIEGESPSPGTN